MTPSVFVGRGRELAWLVERVTDGRPGPVWVRGAPGIGRTSLIRRLRAVRPDLRLCAVTADPAETSVRFGVVAQALLRFGGAGPARVSGTPRQVARRLIGLLRDGAPDGPAVLVVDDVEWADPASALVLAHLVQDRTAGGGPVLVFVSGSPGAGRLRAACWWGRTASSVDVLELDGLVTDDVVQMAAALGRPVNAATARELLARTGGHPVHVRSLLCDPGTSGSPAPVPRSLVRSVHAACAALPAPTRALLDALTVLDGTQSPCTLARLAAAGPGTGPGTAGGTDPAALLVPAVRVGLVHRGPACGRVRVANRWWREALYAALPPARRGTLHRAAAAMVDPPSAWPHRVAATTAVDDGLARDLYRSAATDADRGRHGLAARKLVWAAGLSTGGGRYRQLAAVHAAYDVRSAAPPDIRPTTRGALRCLALGLTALLREGDHAAAEWWLLDALGPGRSPAPDTWVRPAAAAALAGLRMGQDRNGEAREALRLASAGAARPGWLEEHLRVLAATAAARRSGPRRGLDELGHLPADPGDAAPGQLDTLTVRGTLRLLSGRIHEARTDLDTVLSRCPPGDLPLTGSSAWSYRSLIHVVDGNLDAADELAGRALADARSRNLPHARMLAHVCALLVPAIRGDQRTAERHAGEARRIATVSAGRHERHGAAVAEAVCRAASGDTAGMLGALTSLLLDTEPLHTSEWWGLWWRPMLVGALYAAGRPEEATEHRDALCDAASGAPRLEPVLVRLAAAHADAVEPGTAVELVRESPERAAPSSEGVLDHGGRGNRARRRCGSEARLRPAHHAHRRSALTGRELEVVRLVREGLTNRMVAERLAITVKTVEYHMGNVFGKLAISSRDELLDRPAPPG